MPAPSLNLFTWGYSGWGSSTCEFLRAAAAVERTRGFRPPYFVDIRRRRSGRAKGFIGDAFAKAVGKNRHTWIPALGNEAIVSKKGPMRIKDPSAASRLLDLALHRAKRRQRVIFFCQCEYPGTEGKPTCHRRLVASLVLKEARRRGVKAEIVEWPGGAPGKGVIVDVDNAEASKIARGTKKAIDLGRKMPKPKLLGLPWGSVVRFKSRDHQIVAIADVAKCKKSGWFLPVVDVSNDNTVTDLKRQAERDRRDFGLLPRRA